MEKLGAGCTPVKDQATALMEVAAGTADAAVIDALMAGAMVGEGTGYETLAYTQTRANSMASASARAPI